MSKISNVLTMLEYLSSGRKYSISELSEKLEVSPRMIRVYKDEIEKAGIYIDTIKGPYGGYVLNQNINVINGIISDIIGDNKLEGVIINDKYIKLDGLFLLRNSIAPNSIVKDLILEDGYIVVNRNMETNIKGIYACGDCTGNPLQISKATGEGLVAAQNAAKYIDKLKEMI